MAMNAWIAPKPESIEKAISISLAYADVFDCPLTAEEIHRYLVGRSADAAEVNRALGQGLLHQRWIYADGHYALPGRRSIFETHRVRAATAESMWPRALGYARRMASLPFVRMVGLTGALAAHNVDPDADFDYMMITEPGRVWVARLGIVQLVVKPAASRGDEICPNYLVSLDALVLGDHTLFHAHELAQMVPLFGLDYYWRLRSANSWTSGFLPNASALPPSRWQPKSPSRWPRLPIELVLSTPLGNLVDDYELSRMQKQMQDMGNMPEVKLEKSRCKGHSGSHSHRTERAFHERLRALG